jgi:hypothetical protein
MACCKDSFTFFYLESKIFLGEKINKRVNKTLILHCDITLVKDVIAVVKQNSYIKHQYFLILNIKKERFKFIVTS